MEYEILDGSGTSRTVRFHAGAAEVRGIYDRVRSRINRDLRLPGFRPGRVPRSVLDQRYGNLIRSEVAEDIREQLTVRMLDEQDWVLSGSRPAPGDELPVEGEDYVFEITFDLFEIPNPEGYEGLELSIPRFDPDEAVERMIESIRWKMVDYRRTDRPSADRDLVLLEVVRPDADPGSEPERMALRLGGSDLGPGLDDLLTGLSAGASVTARIEFRSGETEEKGRPTTFRLMEVREPLLPEVDDEFARKAGDCPDLGEFKALLRKRLEARWERDRADELERQALDAILERNPFDPPGYMVENLAGDFARNLEGGRDEGTDRAISEIALRKVREFIALRAVGIREGIVPTPGELEAEKSSGASSSSALDRVRNRRALEYVLSKAKVVESAPAGPVSVHEDSDANWKWAAADGA